MQEKRAGGQKSGTFPSYSGKVPVISIKNLRDICDSDLRFLGFFSVSGSSALSL